MSPKEILDAIESAMASLRHISPHQPGKASHRCSLCNATGKHPCPISKAMQSLFEAHSQAFALSAPRTPEGT